MLDKILSLQKLPVLDTSSNVSFLAIAIPAAPTSVKACKMFGQMLKTIGRQLGEFQSFGIFSFSFFLCILTLFIILLKPLTTKSSWQSHIL